MPVFRLTDKLIFPPPHLATKEGLLAIGGDLTPDRLLLAYSMGIFPWYSEGQPILWWSPDPRMVLFPEEFKIPKSLEKKIRRAIFEITFDTAFNSVIEACADTNLRRSDGTWITPEMQKAYCRLHIMGYAHSVEAWCHGELAGGLYGVSLGRMFFGESMFTRIDDASKVCLAALITFAQKHDFLLIDCQVPTDHFKKLGARNIDRKQFILLLTKTISNPSLTGSWSLHR